MLTKIGFFQLSDDDSEPFGSLTKALRARSEDTDVRDSLIVLPEAFNYGRSYYRDPSKEPKFSLDESVKSRHHFKGTGGCICVEPATPAEQFRLLDRPQWQPADVS
jgi:hypothetical protein